MRAFRLLGKVLSSIVMYKLYVLIAILSTLYNGGNCTALRMYIIEINRQFLKLWFTFQLKT